MNSRWFVPIDVSVAAALTAGAFVRGFGLYPWYDDWTYLAVAGDALARGRPREFIWSGFGPHWSPPSFAFEILTLRVAGWESDVFVRLATALLVFCGLLVFAAFARRLGSSGIAVAIGMATLALHHINAAPYYAFDCYDQIGADLLTWIGLGLVLALLDGAVRRPAWGIALAAGLGGVALLIKEVALAFVAGFVLVAGWAIVEGRPPAERRTLWMGVTAAGALSAVFAAARAYAGVWFEADGPHQFCLTCVPGNLGLMISSLIVPSRTLDVFLAVRNWPPRLGVAVPEALAAAAVVMLLASGICAGCRTRYDRSRAALYGMLMLASGFPIALQMNVNELHAHTALFWFAWLVAMATDGWRWRLRDAGRGTRLGMAAVAVVYLTSLGVSLQWNLGEMRSTGERSRAWRQRLHAALNGLPRGSVVLVRGLIMVKAENDYGLYRVTTPGYLLAGAAGVAWRAPNDAWVCNEGDECARKVSHVIDVGGGRVQVSDVLRRPGG